jgi:hypothetical protein
VFARTEELEMLRESAERVARDATANGMPEERDLGAVRSAAEDMGWLALPFAEADGGLGGGAEEIIVLARELGRSLLAGSYVVEHVLGGQLVAAAPEGPARRALLDAMLANAGSVAVADGEPGSRGGCAELRCRARRDGTDWILDGVKQNVWVNDGTRHLVVSAVAEESLGEMLLSVPVDADGLSLQRFRTVDHGQAADCTLKAVRVPAGSVLAPPHRVVRELRQAAWDLASLATSAECVGIMQALIARTAEYLQARQQFGQPLARFQVLRHRMADMALACRRAEVLVARVAGQFREYAPEDRTRRVASAGIEALGGARFVAEQAIQLHGGMGVSAELPVGNYLRRIIALQATFGFQERYKAVAGGDGR